MSFLSYPMEVNGLLHWKEIFSALKNVQFSKMASADWAIVMA